MEFSEFTGWRFGWRKVSKRIREIFKQPFKLIRRESHSTYTVSSIVNCGHPKMAIFQFQHNEGADWVPLQSLCMPKSGSIGQDCFA